MSLPSSVVRAWEEGHGLGEHGPSNEIAAALHRHGRKPRQSFVTAVLSIENRPEVVDGRAEFGHWEADLMIFQRAHGKSNLTSLIERHSRFALLVRNPDRQSMPLVTNIARALQAVPNQACQTITFDRGTEFAAYKVLSHEKGFDVDFCDPHAPWQKGTVENTNGRLRRFLSSEADLAELSSQQLQMVCQRLNDTARKCLAYRTPGEVFQEQLASIEASG